MLRLALQETRGLPPVVHLGVVQGIQFPVNRPALTVDPVTARRIIGFDPQVRSRKSNSLTSLHVTLGLHNRQDLTREAVELNRHVAWIVNRQPLDGTGQSIIELMVNAYAQPRASTFGHGKIQSQGNASGWPSCIGSVMPHALPFKGGSGCSNFIAHQLHSLWIRSQVGGDLWL